MENLNTIPKTGSYGTGVDLHNDNYSKIGLKLETLENMSFNEKGYFETLSALQTKYPTPQSGWQAYVKDAGSSTGYYVANVNSSGNWVVTSAEAPAVGANLNDYALNGGSEKTLKEVEDEIVQLAGETGLVKYTAGDNIIAELTNSDINLDNDIWEDGMWSKNTGQESPSSEHRRTKDFYEIARDVDFNYHFRLAGNAGVCFYDKDGNFINAIWNETGSPSGIVEGSITTDKKARLFKVSHAKSTSPIHIYIKPTETKTIATSDVFLRSDDLPEFQADGQIQEGDEKAVSGNTVFSAGFFKTTEAKTILDPFGSGIPTESAIAEFIKKIQDMSKTYLKGGEKVLIPVNRSVQVDLNIDTLGVAFTEGGTLRLKGFKNGEEKSIYFIESTKKHSHSSNLPLVNTVPAIYKIFLNSEDIDELEVYFDTSFAMKEISIQSILHEDYVEGREFELNLFTELNGLSAAKAKLMHGYKYYQVLDDVTCGANAAFKQEPRIYDLGGFEGTIPYTLLTKCGEKVIPDSIANYGNCVGGTVKDDGYVYAPASPVGLVRSNPSKYSGTGEVTVNRTRVICRNRLESKEISRQYNDFDLVRVPSATTKKDAYNSSVIEWGERSVNLYINGYWGIKQTLSLNSVLDADDTIENAYLIPFQKTREDSTEGSALRIWLYTKKGKCYYNYAVAEEIRYSDVNTWAESTIYNQFRNFVPVNDKSKATSYKKYFPVLLNFDYGQTNDLTDPATIYERPFLKLQQNVSPFRVLTKNSISRLDHITAFANYNTVRGQEPFVMLTSNGGKTWYVKAYFAVTDAYFADGTGGAVNFAPISSLAPYAENSLNLRRRRYNHPTEDVKEPDTRYILNTNETVPVKSMTFDSAAGTMRVELDADTPWLDNANYNVVYFENVSADNEWNPICNTGITPNAATTTHIFFRTMRINNREFHLYADLGNTYEGSLVCRHVHSINATSGGFVIATGESKRPLTDGEISYEGGDLYYMEDTIRNHSTARGSVVGRLVHRLTSSKNGVMRACGAYLTQNGEIIFASDQGFQAQEILTVEGRTLSIPKTPVGIYKGKLQDIDDWSKFKCIKDLDYTVLSLLVNSGRFACDYKHGHTVVSPDGEKWIELKNIREYITGLDSNGDFYLGSNLKIEWRN